MKKIKMAAAAAMLFSGLATTPAMAADEQAKDFTTRTYNAIEIPSEVLASSQLFKYDSGLTFEYPDAVRGIFVTGHSAGGGRFDSLIELINTTDLNAMVIDIKEDFGYLTYVPEEGSKLAEFEIGQPYIKD